MCFNKLNDGRDIFSSKSNDGVVMFGEDWNFFYEKQLSDRSGVP